MKHTLGFILATLITAPVLAHGVVAIKGGSWWNEKTFEARTMYSVDGVLRSSPGKGEIASTIDLAGAFVLPALGDAHQHAFADGMNVDEQIASAQRSGIFYLANPNNSARLTTEARTKVNRPESVDIIYSNGGLTASGGHPAQIYDQIGARIGLTPGEADGQVYFIVDDAAALERRWPEVLAGRPDFIKTYLETSEEYETRRDDPAYYGKRGLDPALLPDIVRRARASGLRTACHVTTRHDFLVAVQAGVDIIAHLPLEALTDDDARAAAKRGTTVVTTVLSHRPTPGVDDLHALHAKNLATLSKHGVALALGTDNGGVDVVDEAIAVRDLGVFDTATVINLLTRDTPRLIFPARRIGCLADGCEATFVALSGNPLQEIRNLRAVSTRVRNGHALDIREPERKRPVLEGMAPAFHKGGVDAALAEYRRLRKDEPDHWDFSEAQLNAFGYQLLAHGAIDDAIKVFDANAALFPDSFNVWDSLGEAWMKKGEKARAIELYEKSLRMNPHNKNAVSVLESLRE